MKLLKFVDQLSDGLETVGRFRMCAAYRSAIRSISDFTGGSVSTLEQVFNKDFLHRYEEYLKLLGRKRNTISFYMTVLRMIYNDAVRLGKLAHKADLFADLSTGNGVTPKRAVDSSVIAVLHSADLSAIPHLDRCRDLFMLSFHLQGMSFIDLVYLRKAEVQSDMVVYHRHKTGGVVNVSLLEPAMEILDKYASQVIDSPYVLPLITMPGGDGYRQYQNALRNHNRQLKVLAEHLGIQENLTSYVARHTWATLAYHNGVNVSLVSQAMGHQTEEVTRIYLSSFEREKLAEANRVVLEAILRPIREGYIKPVVYNPDSRIGCTNKVNRISGDFQQGNEGFAQIEKEMPEGQKNNTSGETKNVHHYGNEGHR